MIASVSVSSIDQLDERKRVEALAYVKSKDKVSRVVGEGTFVAMAGGKYVGYLAMLKPSLFIDKQVGAGKTLYLTDIHVEELSRKTGVGKLLMQKALIYLKGVGKDLFVEFKEDEYLEKYFSRFNVVKKDSIMVSRNNITQLVISSNV